jgi:hypothetical protein
MLMECIQPGAVHDEELLAYLAGENVRPIVVQHLANCHYCSSRLESYRRIELMLTGKLYRWDCPSNQVLGEYHLGLLSNDVATAVKIHLSMCVLCTAELATLANFLANDPMLVEQPRVAVLPSELHNHRPVRGAEQILGQLRKRSGAGVRRIIAAFQPVQPRLAFQRDVTAAPVWPRRYAAEDVSVSIHLEPGTGSLQLIGFVTRSSATLGSLQGTPVLLSSQAQTLQTQHIDELGNFIFSSVAPATYTLELQFPETTIVIEQLTVAFQD